MTTQLDRIEMMLTELIKVSRKERAKKREEELVTNANIGETIHLGEIRNILEFGGDIN